MNTISLSKVVPDKDQPRKYFAAEKMASLKDSIKKHGVINPIIVEKMGDKFLLIDGERRFRASTEIGLKEIPYIIVPSKDPLSRIIERFHIQEQHETWSEVEKAQTILDICETMNKPISVVCELLSISTRMARMYASFARLQNKDKFIEYQCSIPHAEKIESIKTFTRKLKEDVLEESFSKADERKLEKVLIEKIKDGEIRNLQSYTKIKDSFVSNPKLIDKFMNGSEEVSDMFVKSKAKAAYHLRNMLHSCHYVESHVNSFLKNPNVAISDHDKRDMKTVISSLKKVLDLAGD